MNRIVLSVLLFSTLIDAQSQMCPPDPEVTGSHIQCYDNLCANKTMSCLEGYQMHFRLKCEDGITTNLVPICKPVQCLADPVIMNGVLDDDITTRDVGDSYNYTCTSPYVKNGISGIVTCNVTGQWETNLECEKVQCMADPVIMNGELVNEITSRDVGWLYGYKCNSPYTKNGIDGLVTCKGNGEWEANLECELVQCLADPVIMNGVLDDDITTRDVGDSYNYTCTSPYVKNGISGIVTCNVTGQWETNLECEKVQCMADPVIMNGELVNEITSRDVGWLYGYKCNSPYTKNGIDGLVTCKGNGEWEANLECELDCYKYTLERYVDVDIHKSYRRTTYATCLDNCAKDENCTAAYVNKRHLCLTFTDPVIYGSFTESFDMCQKNCTQMEECVTLSHRNGRECLLYKAGLENLPSIRETSTGTIAENTCRF